MIKSTKLSVIWLSIAVVYVVFVPGVLSQCSAASSCSVSVSSIANFSSWTAEYLGSLCSLGGRFTSCLNNITSCSTADAQYPTYQLYIGVSRALQYICNCTTTAVIVNNRPCISTLSGSSASLIPACGQMTSTVVANCSFWNTYLPCLYNWLQRQPQCNADVASVVVKVVAMEYQQYVRALNTSDASTCTIGTSFAAGPNLSGVTCAGSTTGGTTSTKSADFQLTVIIVGAFLALSRFHLRGL